MGKEEIEDSNIPKWRLLEWFPDLGADVVVKLKIFYAEVIKANSQLLLVPQKSLAQADLYHFADCIISCRLIKKDIPNIKNIFDIGSGSGFPGVVFAILFPEVRVTIVASNPLRANFLRGATSFLKLDNVWFDQGRFEAHAADSMTYAMTRGYTTIAKVILFGRKMFVKGGIIYHIKADEWGAELAEIPTQLCSIWAPSLVGEYRAPVTGSRHAVLKTEKLI